MRSADLRAGLTRVVAHSGRPFAHRSAEGIAISWRWLAPSAVVTTILLLATWHAGRESAQLEGQRLGAQINLLTQKIASNSMQLERQRKKTGELEQVLRASGKTPDLVLLTQLHQQLLVAQAEANQYKTIILRERQKAADDQRLVDVLAAPGAHMLAMRGSDAAAESSAYALVAENGRLLLVASRLPKLADGREFQLWVVRKQDPKIVSAGVFRADDNSGAVMNFNDASLLADLAELEITEEPNGGSSEPTGARLLGTGVSEKSE